MGKTINYSNLRANLKKNKDKVCDDSVPYVVKRRNGDNVVVISEDDYNSMDETEYLMRSPRNKAVLDASIERVKKGETLEIRDLKKFIDALGI